MQSRPPRPDPRRVDAPSAALLPRPRRALATAGLLLTIVIALSGCGGGGSSGGAGSGPPVGQGTTTSTSSRPASCEPNGPTLRVSARGNRFDQQCLAGPAGTPLAITFQNQDQGVAHNLAVYSDAQQSRTLFKGKIIQGVATVVYHVPPLPAGSYYFQCDVHPQTMNGTLVVR